MLRNPSYESSSKGQQHQSLLYDVDSSNDESSPFYDSVHTGLLRDVSECVSVCVSVCVCECECIHVYFICM
jgi:hypothetical protein